MRFHDYPAAKIAAYLDSNQGRLPGRRAWKKFTDWAYETYGDFAELTGGGGFSGSAKLLAAGRRSPATRVAAAGQAVAPPSHDGGAPDGTAGPLE